MILTELIRKVLLENINPILQQLKDKYVGENKLFSESEFKKLEEVTGNKWYLTAWLTKKVATNLIKKEDIYKWSDYFKTFEKNKKKFKFQDLNQYKTADDIKYLIETIVEIMESDIQFDEIPQSNAFLSKNEIEKLTSEGRNKYLGFYKPGKGLKIAGKDGYQVFQISEVSKTNWKVYRDLLGRCKGREKGARIEICTIGQYHYFKQYLTDPKGSHYIVLFNLNDPLSPYQLHVESNQFMNKNDVERFNFDRTDFLKWLTTKSDVYTLDKIAKGLEWEIPVDGKGYEDEKGFQGLWKEYNDNKVQYTTYINNKPDGPSIVFYDNKKIYMKGTLKGNLWIGPYEEYFKDGQVIQKGVFGTRERPIGVWEHWKPQYGATMILRDYDDSNSPVTGLTKSGQLKFIADKAGDFQNISGKIVSFNPSGTPRITGTITPKGLKTGTWTVFGPDGSIKLEGNFRGDKPVGEWTFFFSRPNQKYLYVINFDENKKGKLYNDKGEFIKKVPFSDEKIPSLYQLIKF